MYSGTS